MSECGRTYDFTRGDGHTIGSHWKTCARRNEHPGKCANRWEMSDAQRAEDEAARRADGARLMAFIQRTGSNHTRRQAAHALIEAGLREHPDEPFTITVPGPE